MSRPPAGRLHLSFWVAIGVLLYLASCPPVEAWHEKRMGRNAHTLPMQMPGPGDHVAALGAGIPAGGRGDQKVNDGDEFEITELHYFEPPPQPQWMQVLYGPVHWLEKFAPFETFFHRYREWCDTVM